MLNIRLAIKVLGLTLKVMMPVLSVDYAIGLQISNPYLLTIDQTGFLALT
jgi:hypothetical protein